MVGIGFELVLELGASVRMHGEAQQATHAVQLLGSGRGVTAVCLRREPRTSNLFRLV
jgi:hypothetical protein